MRNYINQNGFSLMSTIVATGLVGALSLGVMRLLDQGYKGSSDLNARQELRDIRDEFYVSLKTNSCGLVSANELLENKDLKFNEDDGKNIPISSLYNRFHTEFKPGTQYGKLTIKKTDPFFISPLGRNSPFLEGGGNIEKTKGGFFKLSDSEYVAELNIQMVKPKSAGKGSNGEGVMVPLSFTVLLEVIEGKITGCKTMSQLSAAKESCESMYSENGEIDFEWESETNKCSVTVINNNSSTDTYDTDEPGAVDPMKYILSSIK
jgi:hypothetical protein